MKSIGILTFWNVPNYGAFMQAYALQKTLENRYKDYEVKQIGYLEPKHYNVYYSKSIKTRFHHWYINPHYYKELIKQINSDRDEQICALKKFLGYYKIIPNYHCSTKQNLMNLKLDTLVLGSDIIWDYTVPFFGNDGLLFGKGINANNKISYAPGCGSVKDGKDAPDYVVDSLKELNAISVRDEKSAQIVKNITGKNTTVVLDPTLLWDFYSDSNVVKPNEDRYIVVYGSFFTEELIKGAKVYAKNNGLKLICLSSLDDKFDWCDIVVNQDEMNPFEWVGYFKYAEAVMTCTYHGLLFSLIFEKKIVFNMTDFIWNKSQSLVEELGLKEVLVDYKSFDEKVNWNWNYSEINEFLEKMRKKSLDFLDGCMSGSNK